MALDPRRLAAADMYGTRGSARRRRIVRAEFVLGAVLCIGLGLLSITSASGIWLWVGIWLVGVGANYVILAVDALRLSRPGALEAELRGADVRRELRRAGTRQLWIAIPFALWVAAVGRYRP